LMLIREDPTLDEKEAREEGPLSVASGEDDTDSMANPIVEKSEPNVKADEPDVE
jgi:hypothetical protein